MLDPIVLIRPEQVPDGLHRDRDFLQQPLERGASLLGMYRTARVLHKDGFKAQALLDPFTNKVRLVNDPTYGVVVGFAVPFGQQEAYV